MAFISNFYVFITTVNSGYKRTSTEKAKFVKQICLINEEKGSESTKVFVITENMH